MNEDDDWNMWQTEDLFDAVAPSLALAHSIQQYTNLVPTRLMLPLSLMPKAEEFNGLPIYRGDRVALIYEPVG